MENLQDLVESLPETEVSPLHNTPAPAPYKYKKLTSPTSIRVLSLLPCPKDNTSQELRCTLQEVSLDSNPTFQALSYTVSIIASPKFIVPISPIILP